MTSWAVRVYRRLPASARSVAATLQGYYLRWWRYGPVAERVAREARERELWTTERWTAWREERLAYVLHRAATRVPHYRAHWAERRRRGDRASWELLENWPILGKEELRLDARAFLADDCSPNRMFHVRTSGTTGTPLDLWRSRLTVQTLYGIGAARTRGWHGVTLRDRRAMLGGQMVTPVAQRRPPFWVWNAAMRQLYMSTHHLAPDLAPYYLDALARYRIRYLTGYASSIHTLAEEALRLGRDDLRMVVAITSSEPLLARQREVIAQAFQCPVRETYGMGENVAAAAECEAGHLHQWPEVGIIEVLDGDDRIPAGAPGEFVCTGLLNPDMPLIRYRVGDSGRMAAGAEPCSCGRTLPIIASIEGRTNDLLFTRDGRQVYWLNPVLYGLPVRQAQIVQESVERVRVRFVPAPGFTTDAGRTIAERLRERLGDVSIVLEEVREIPRTATGKFRAVVCELTEAQRNELLQARRASAVRG